MARPIDRQTYQVPDAVESTRLNATSKADRSIGELFAELSQEATTLIRQEVALAKAEMTEKATQFGKDIAFLVAGAALGYAGLLAFLAFAVAVLALAVPLWLSALIVSVAVLALAGLLVMRGMSDLKKRSLAPNHTIETAKEDINWAKHQVE